ncbi:hypothetical protein SAMN05421505_11262 [Sinosporangium album]|uniref:Uncharacterized protein n=2 Tax=Sinosporangium album TaxID=504805 RepID=A0A1G8A963_9ACTN|nr:hypothetical protein SAMN05421505_11262 [Sinosporangium album]
MKYRMQVGLLQLVFAGGLALLALYVSPMWILTMALWYGVVAFTWQGFRTMLGKVKPRGEPRLHGTAANSSVPPSSSPGVAPVGGAALKNERDELRDAVLDSGHRIVQGMRRTVVVLLLVFLVPATVLLVWTMVDSFVEGDIFTGALMAGAAVFIARYCWYHLLRPRDGSGRQTGATHDYSDSGGGSGE